jgi:hypothetical protein
LSIAFPSRKLAIIEIYDFVFHFFARSNMRTSWNLTSLIVGLFVMAFALTNTGCTPKITDEQLSKLRLLKEQAAQLELDIKKKEAEKSALEKEVASRQAEDRQSSQNIEFIKQKLQTWPNSWPDFVPPSTEGVIEMTPAPVKKKKGKK